MFVFGIGSVSVDEEDLELLMVMENLAHANTQTVDANSALGSQVSEPGEGRVSAGGEPESDEDEGDKWLDRTLVGDELEEESRPITPLLQEENQPSQPSQHSNQE